MSTPSDDDFDNDLLQEGLGRTLANTPMQQPDLPGLGSTLAAADTAQPPQSYIDVYTYPGEHGFRPGHTAVAVDGGRAYGLEPIPDAGPASALGPVRGYVQPIPKQRVPNGHVRIPVTASQADAARQYILSSPGGHSYALTGPNCVTFVQGALDEAGVKNPMGGFGMLPNTLLKELSQMYGTPQP